MENNIGYKDLVFVLIGVLLIAVAIGQSWLWWARVSGASVGSVLLLFCVIQWFTRGSDGFGLTVMFGLCAVIVSLVVIGITAYQLSGEKSFSRLIFEILGAILLTLLLTGISSDFVLGRWLRFLGSRLVP